MPHRTRACAVHGLPVDGAVMTDGSVVGLGTTDLITNETRKPVKMLLPAG